MRSQEHRNCDVMKVQSGYLCCPKRSTFGWNDDDAGLGADMQVTVNNVAAAEDSIVPPCLPLIGKQSFPHHSNSWQNKRPPLVSPNGRCIIPRWCDSMLSSTNIINLSK